MGKTKMWLHLCRLTLFAVFFSVSSAVQDKPVVNCAFKWAESPDDIFIYVKWAHNLGAPAVNNILSEDVIVEIGEDRLYISAEHSTKTMKLEIPQLMNKVSIDLSSYSIITFGVNLVLRKKEIQDVWGSLLPSGVAFPRSIHTWWEMKNKYEDENAQVKSTGSSIKWLEDNALGCEACRLTVTSSFFSPLTLKTLKELQLPSGNYSPQSQYNQTLHKLLLDQCNTLGVPTRAAAAVKIKGDTHSDSLSSMRKKDNILHTDIYRGCVGLVKTKPKSNKLLQALNYVHKSLLYNKDDVDEVHEEVSTHGLSYYPINFDDVAATHSGREIIRRASIMACHDQKPSICPLSYSDSSSHNPAVSHQTSKKIPSSECQVCKLLVDELELKTLRLHQNSTPSIEDEVDNVCNEIKWRHFESDNFDTKCHEIIEHDDEKILKYLKSTESSKSSSNKAVSDLCGCTSNKKKKSKKGKSKKEL